MVDSAQKSLEYDYATEVKKHQRYTKFMLLCLTLAILAIVVIGAGCAPRGAESGGSSPGGDAVAGNGTATEVVAWSMQSDCAACHVAQGAGQDANAPAVTHANQGSACVTCHGDESKMAVAHEGASASATMPTRLKKTTVDPTLCESCHSSRDLIAQTATSSVLTDAEGKVVNPHEIPVNSSHNSVSCTSCHQLHQPSTALPEKSRSTCFDCHHEKVLQCGTCHD